MQKKHILFTAFVCVFAVACYFGGQALSDYVYNAGRAPESQSEAEPAEQTPAPSPSASPELPFEFVSELTIYPSSIQTPKPAEPQRSPTTETVAEDGTVTIHRDLTPTEDAIPAGVGATANLGGDGYELEMTDDVYLGDHPDQTPAAPSTATETPAATPAPSQAPASTETPAPSQTPAATPKPSQAPSKSQSGAYGTYDADGKPLWEGTVGEVSPDGMWGYNSRKKWVPTAKALGMDDSDKSYGGLSGVKVGSFG